MYIDALGKACPMPVIMAKKELDNGCREVTVAVDNKTAVENLSRLASTKGLQVKVTEKDGIFEVAMFVDAEQAAAVQGREAGIADRGAEDLDVKAAPTCGPSGCGYAVFIGKDVVGEGERELGENLMKMAIYTLSQSEEVPASLLFMNSGVKLPAGEEQQVIDSLKELQEKGTEILVCGTCLNYYGLTEKLQIGTVSNMYDILGKMQSAAKVVTL